MKKTLESILLLAAILILAAAAGLPADRNFVIATSALPLLPPHEHRDGDGISKHGFTLYSGRVVIPEDMWVTKFKMVINNAPPTILHHALLLRPGEPNALCPQSMMPFVVIASSSEKKMESTYPPPYGMFLTAGTELELETMIHNPLPPVGPGGTYRDVSVSLIMEIKKGNRQAGLMPFEFYLMHIDDDPCLTQTQTFTVPAGAEHFTKAGSRNPGDPAKFTFKESGQVIFLSGHFHPWDGGEKLEAWLNDKLIAEFFPERTSSEPWSWIIPAMDAASIPIQKGDILSIQATYSNPSPRDFKDAMGFLGFFFAPDEE